MARVQAVHQALLILLPHLHWWLFPCQFHGKSVRKRVIIVSIRHIRQQKNSFHTFWHSNRCIALLQIAGQTTRTLDEMARSNQAFFWKITFCAIFLE